MRGFDFSNKKFLVSGAGGIGAETAKLLNSCGASIILLDISEDNLNSVIVSLEKGDNKAYICDFSNIDGIDFPFFNLCIIDFIGDGRS